MATDESWAEVARSSREALALLGYPIRPRCLPDEPEACGATFAQHATAHLAAIKAVADHQVVLHLGPEFAQMQEEIYWHKYAELLYDCRTHDRGDNGQ